MRKATVELLIEVLKCLPPETEIWQATSYDVTPVDRLEDEIFLLWEHEGKIRLVIDDREAFHGEKETQWNNIFAFGPAHDRVPGKFEKFGHQERGNDMGPGLQDKIDEALKLAKEKLLMAPSSPELSRVVGNLEEAQLWFNQFVLKGAKPSAPAPEAVV